MPDNIDQEAEDRASNNNARYTGALQLQRMQELQERLQAVNTELAELRAKFTGDWIEDQSHENGNYLCICMHCKRQFIGHKRRVVCKTCSDTHELAELRKERERLDWLQTTYTSIGYNVENSSWGVDFEAPYGKTIREAIDAALSQQETKGEQP